jgi:hypothetical protein
VEQEGGVEVGDAAWGVARRDAGLVVVGVPGSGVVITGLVVVMPMVHSGVVAVVVAVMVRLAVVAVVVPGGGAGRQIGVQVRVVAPRVPVDDDALRGGDHGGGKDRRQQRGEAGPHPSIGYETSQGSGWVATGGAYHGWP